MSKKLEFQWRDRDFELRARPRRLVRLEPNEENVTIDFIHWSVDSSGHEYCYSIGYFYYDDREDIWELKFVGNRFMDIPPEKASEIWRKLGAAYTVLNEFSNDDD